MMPDGIKHARGHEITAHGPPAPGIKDDVTRQDAPSDGYHNPHRVSEPLISKLVGRFVELLLVFIPALFPVAFMGVFTMFAKSPVTAWVVVGVGMVMVAAGIGSVGVIRRLRDRRETSQEQPAHLFPAIWARPSARTRRVSDWRADLARP